MLYPKNSEASVSDALFENPTAEYRATPFWAWNCELNPELLCREIDAMKEMGFGGFHMHSRVGMATPYLSDEFMELVRTCVEKARQENMLAWLYDEDKWPSGYAGGFNTKKRENRSKNLTVVPRPFAGDEEARQPGDTEPLWARPGSECVLLACYDVERDAEGFLLSYTRIGKTDAAAHQKWFAYLVYAADENWYNGESYVDTLSKSAIEDFVKLTHERYRECVGKDFGGLIPAIFTDEPQFARKHIMDRATSNDWVNLTFTSDFDETFSETYGYSILDSIPEVIWELPAHRASRVRYHYHDHVAERFASAYADTVGDWCKNNGIHLTGHMMEEPTLHSQTAALGDCMRSYRSFSLPGIDMLVDQRELTTAKQCQSAVHQYGREGMLSELYGVTNWCFDFRGHKLQGDWQAALGVTVRVPHLFWVSMSGEAKRDYPASIGYQSPWYREYKYIEDHFARVNTVMTRGTPDVRIGVIHPVESYWLRFGPGDTTQPYRDELQKHFEEVIHWLLFGTLDFDYICESLLPSQFGGCDDGFRVGQMHYDVILVPGLLTMRRTTLDALRAFRAHGGKVVFMGDVPSYVDALPTDEVREFACECTALSWSRSALYDTLEENRIVRCVDWRGYPSGNLIYQLRQDGAGKHLFVCHVYKPGNYDIAGNEDYDIRIRGDWKVTERDTVSGKLRPLSAVYENGWTTVRWSCSACDSVLLDLEPGRREEGVYMAHPSLGAVTRLAEKVPYTLSEPNVLLLDRPFYSLNGGDEYGPENILKADDRIRTMLGMRHRNDAMVQPWVHPVDRDPKDTVRLTFRVQSEIEYTGAQLAMEAIEFSTVLWNGEAVDLTPTGFYIDPESIHTVALPPIRRGENTLEITLRFGDITQIESYYLLGDFGVRVSGSSAVITERASELTAGDISSQSLPFYGGNVTYHYTLNGGGHRAIELSRYVGAAVTVDVDGVRAGHLTFPPYLLDLGDLSDGEHRIDVTVFGTRMNTLGDIHNVDELEPCGPFVWRTSGNRFAYEYMLLPMGLLTTPRILEIL